MEKNVLSGTYVELIPLSVEDAELTFKWRNLERAQFLNQGSTNIDQQLAWIAARPKNEINWIITLKQSGVKVGMLSLININSVFD